MKKQTKVAVLTGGLIALTTGTAFAFPSLPSLTSADANVATHIKAVVSTGSAPVSNPTVDPFKVTGPVKEQLRTVIATQAHSLLAASMRLRADAATNSSTASDGVSQLSDQTLGLVDPLTNQAKSSAVGISANTRASITEALSNEAAAASGQTSASGPGPMEVVQEAQTVWNSLLGDSAAGIAGGANSTVNPGAVVTSLSGSGNVGLGLLGESSSGSPEVPVSGAASSPGASS